MDITSGVLAVVDGRMVTSIYSSNVQFPINGQQLMMQLDSLTSSMRDMEVTKEEDMVGNKLHLFKTLIKIYCRM
jgi:hypothetical protein